MGIILITFIKLVQSSNERDLIRECNSRKLSSNIYVINTTVNEVDKVCGEVGGGGEGGIGLHFHIKSNQVISKKLRYILGLV